jgi:hypothetical protein
MMHCSEAYAVLKLFPKLRYTQRAPLRVSYG